MSDRSIVNERDLIAAYGGLRRPETAAAAPTPTDPADGAARPDVARSRHSGPVFDGPAPIGAARPDPRLAGSPWLPPIAGGSALPSRLTIAVPAFVHVAPWLVWWRSQGACVHHIGAAAAIHRGPIDAPPLLVTFALPDDELPRPRKPDRRRRYSTPRSQRPW